MEAKLIEGILYTELDEELGPNPLVWIGDMHQSSRLHISVNRQVKSNATSKHLYSEKYICNTCSNSC